MSQKTNPTSLRLQKISQNFAFPLFADCFWSETYQACFERQEYISSFLKETSFSKAFFSAKMFYRKFPIFIFIQDNRVTKKEKLLFFKNSFSRHIDKKSRLSKKLKIKDKAFDTNSENIKGFSLQQYSFAENDGLQNKVFSDTLCKDFGLVKQLIRNDYLKAKQGFFKNMSNIASISQKKGNLSTFKKDEKLLFDKKIYKTEFFWPKQLTLKSPKIFARPCFSFCENIISISYHQRKNVSIYNALYSSQKNLTTNKNLHLFARRTLNEPNFYCLPSLQDQRNQNKVVPEATPEVSSREIYSEIKKMQKRKMSFLVNNSARKTLFFPTNVTLEPIRFIREYQNVTSLVDQVIALLEKRISFRQIKSLLFKDLLHYPQIKGIRISCSGRLGGRSKKAQKAKVQSDSCGATTLAAFSSNILFASKSASTSYGKVGVKIWLSFTDKRC